MASQPHHEAHTQIDAQRRRLLVAASSLSAGSMLPAQAANSGSQDNPSVATQTGSSTPLFAYVGSRTTRERNARGDGITVFRVSPKDGALDKVQVVGDLINPSYFAMSKDGSRLYTVHGDESDVSAFAVDRETGMLRFINRQSTLGKNPVHLAIDHLGTTLVVTNHLGSSLAVLPLANDGALLPVRQLVTLSGPLGPHRIEQKQSKPHFNLFDASGQFVLVPDKGVDRVFSFRFQNGQLTPTTQSFVGTREGSGPRHLVMHPTKPLAYVVNELDSTVTSYRLSVETGALEPLHIVSTLPSTFTGNSRAAAIGIDRQGGHLYVSNRGHDSIALFALAADTGLPQFVDTAPTLGRTPRHFSLSPDQRILFALNEDSDSIVSFWVDSHSGWMQPTGQVAQAGSPVCMHFSP